jgi:hypothetical protein
MELTAFGLNMSQYDLTDGQSDTNDPKQTEFWGAEGSR